MDHSPQVATRSQLPPALLLIAVCVAIVAQLVPGVPLAGAAALAAWGTALAVARSRALLTAAVLVYAPLVVWAIAAEIDLAMRANSLVWGWVVASDAAAGVILIWSLVRETAATVRRS